MTLYMHVYTWHGTITCMTHLTPPRNVRTKAGSWELTLWLISMWTLLFLVSTFMIRMIYKHSLKYKYLMLIILHDDTCTCTLYFIKGCGVFNILHGMCVLSCSNVMLIFYTYIHVPSRLRVF